MADMRRCIGSARFGIEAHEAPPEDFPRQPSQKDGLGRMCKPHWREYVNALRKAALFRKADTAAAQTRQSQAAARVATKRAARVATVGKKPEPIRTRPARGRKTDGDLIATVDDAGLTVLEEASAD